MYKKRSEDDYECHIEHHTIWWKFTPFTLTVETEVLQRNLDTYFEPVEDVEGASKITKVECDEITTELLEYLIDNTELKYFLETLTAAKFTMDTEVL